MKLIKKSLMAFILIGIQICLKNNKNSNQLVMNTMYPESEQIMKNLTVPLLKREEKLAIDLEENFNANQQPKQQKNNLRPDYPYFIGSLMEDWTLNESLWSIVWFLWAVFISTIFNIATEFSLTVYM